MSPLDDSRDFTRVCCDISLLAFEPSQQSEFESVCLVNIPDKTKRKMLECISK